MEIFGYIGAFFIGIILGLTGGGGSILTVPLLVYVMSYNPVVSAAYSLFVVGTSSAFGATLNYRKKLVDIKTGFLFAIPSFIGVFVTRKYIVSNIPNIIFQNDTLTLTRNTFLMLLFAIIMLFAALSMIKKPKVNLKEVTRKHYLAKIIIQNITIGIIIGLVGAGGGFLIIPSLLLITKLPMKKAVGTSMFIIAMNSLIGFLGDLQNIQIDWKFLLPFSIISMIGIFTGTYISKYINEVQLKKGFAYFVLLMAFVITFKELM
ncbi:sulfite exporter TauE/SafE family protein [Flavobacterium jejuense]|uniref:Probable membrane transporter protein n=1 Tax=Flavobacterium jejuense TaxID=1544455 RepID=A0ABX0IMS5_9FLAO|nr:sulfite exporter TauE/SafE family protein [Flavobacterium jejuense]NHN24891.1 sulfite exporter TauE/SafE family protein [Flavobacterium jejuense]